jgi:uncharacterized membrane protein YuzA (DUF378 family)
MDKVSMAIATQVILIIGALNWGFVALNNTDMVQSVVGKNSQIDRLIKTIVFGAGLYASYQLYVVYGPK